MNEGKYIPQPAALDTSRFTFPSQPQEDPVIREVKNKVCIDGHLNTALNEILATNSPDAIFNILGQLAHRAIELAFTAQQAGTGTVETLRKGFMVTESCGPDKRHEIRIKYQSLEDLDQASHELTGLLKRDLMHSVAVAKVKVLPGRERIVQKMACLEVMGDGALLYGDPRGPFHASVRPLPPAHTHLRFKGDCGQFGGFEECAATSVGAFPVYTGEQLRNYRDDRDFEHKPALPVAGTVELPTVRRYEGVLASKNDLPSPAFYEDGVFFQVMGGDAPGEYMLDKGEWLLVVHPSDSKPTPSKHT